jgi:5-amino-6-(5-phosphoribosylamino)uracil reductase
MFIFSNLATSIDGKIATSSREFFPLGTPEDRRQMQRLRRESDAILMGATTLRTFRRPLIVVGEKKQPLNVIMSSALEGVSASWPFFTSPSIQRLLYVAPHAKRAQLKKFEKSSEIVVLKKPTKKLPTALQVARSLEKRGVRNLLVEGGGGIMWDFASQDLIDEYHVTITPRVLGGTEAPTLVDGAGLPPKQVVNLKLSQCRVVGDELYLIYRKTGKRGP